MPRRKPKSWSGWIARGVTALTVLSFALCHANIYYVALGKTSLHSVIIGWFFINNTLAAFLIFKFPLQNGEKEGKDVK